MMNTANDPGRTGRVLAAFLAVFFLFLSFQLLVPLTSDDLCFKNHFQSLSGALSYAWQRYYIWDGRVGSYFINHTLLYLPHWITSLILALTPLLLITAVLMHALGPAWKEKLTWRHVLGTCVLLWLTVPSFGQVFFWRTGSPYSIIPIFFLFILWPYRLLLTERKSDGPLFLGAALLAAYAGLCDFSMSVAVAAITLAAGLYAFFCLKIRQVRLFIPPLFLLISFLFIYTAPGNSARVKDTAFLNSSFFQKLFSHLANQGEVQLLFLWPYVIAALAVILYLAGRRRQQSHTEWPWVPAISAFALFLAAQAAQMAYMLAPSAASRSYTSAAVLMLTAALTLYYSLDTLPVPRMATALKKCVWTIVIILSLVSVSSSLLKFYVNHTYIEDILAAVRSSPPGADLRVPPGPYRSDNYFFSGRSHQIQDNPADWMSRCFATYYGLSSIGLRGQELDMATPQGFEEALLEGTARDSVLTFSYNAPERFAGEPFILIFPKPPRHPFRWQVEKTFLPRLAGYGAVRRYIVNNYEKVIPVIQESGPQGVAGTALLPHLEHTDSGYILYKHGKEHILIPLEIRRQP